MINYDVVIVGGGVAGLSAAIEAKKQGIDKILLLEHEKFLGGVLNQCIHNGFGKFILKEEVTGPEYANIFIEEIKKNGIEYKIDTTVIEICKDKKITYVNPKEGVVEVVAKAIIIATGCREKTRGAANISGSSFAGVFTAGMVQKIINLEGVLPGKNVVILGSGDLGLIVAKTLTLEGAKVKAVIEMLPYCSGLEENYIECLKAFGIPLKLQHTIVDIKGKERVNGVTIARVDEGGKPIKSSEEFMTCDTVVLSVGLIPEVELFRSAGIHIDEDYGGTIVDDSMQTNIEGIFACGNSVHLHDYVDDVTIEGAVAGNKAAKYVKMGLNKKNIKKVKKSDGLKYILPKYFNIDNIEKDVQFKFRTDKIFRNANIKFEFEGKEINFYRDDILPSKMEIITLPKEILSEYKDYKTIEVSICEL